MTHEQQLCEWIAADPLRMRALEIARELDLPDWCIAAGFVRNLAWDKLHGYAQPTPLSDIDLIYFDRSDMTTARERALEARLAAIDPALPWSVRNQARMHVRNGDTPYGSMLDAMRHWVELETALGVTLEEDGRLRIVSAFGLDTLFAKMVTHNVAYRSHGEFAARLVQKKWLQRWPELRVSRSD
jgi:uncharacterized protein